MSDLGELNYFLCLKFCKLNDEIFISQPNYALDLLEKNNILECKLNSTPFQSGNNFTKECSSKSVDSTLYR